MKYDLTKPCKDCPFRKDIRAYLNPERAQEICESIIDDQQTFSCHKFNGFDDDGVTIEGERAQHCAGAMIFLEKIDRPNQMMRIAERLGMYDRTKLQMDAPVFESPDEFIKAQEDTLSKARAKRKPEKKPRKKIGA